MVRYFLFIVYIFFGLMLVSCTSSGSKQMPFFSTEEEEDLDEEYSEEDEKDFSAKDDNDDEDLDEEDYSEEEEYAEEEDDEDSTYGSESYGNYVDSMPSTPTKTWVPLKKIPRTTWKHDGKWINAVYIARPGENLSSVSSKIYGNTNKQDELKSINPFLKRREPKVGDKIYYNSPVRPMDRSKFLFYYDDINRSPTSHDINSGENIRTVSKNLLGHVDSWKEIWATNEQVESKGVLDQTVTILYWPDSSSVSPSPVADNNMPSSNMPEALPTMDEPSVEEMPTQPEIVEPDPVEVADNNIPPLPDDIPTDSMEEPIFEDDPMVAENNMPEPSIEEPPIFDEPQVVEEEPMASEPVEAESEKKGVLDFNNWKVKGGLIAFVFFAVALWFARLIRNRKNRPDFDFSQTNVDIDSIEE